MPTSTHGRPYKKYIGPGEVLRDTIYVKVTQAPDGHVYVWWKGTGEDRRDVVFQWEEDAILAAGGRSPGLDADLDYVLNRWGFESETVSHDGFSRGGAPAAVGGGRSYGGANFAAYPPREGAEKVASGYGQAGSWGIINSAFHNILVDPVSHALVDMENATGLHADAYTFAPHTATSTQHPMAPISQRGRTLVHRKYPDGSAVVTTNDVEMQNSPGGQATQTSEYRPWRDAGDTYMSQSSLVLSGTKRTHADISSDTPRTGGDFSGLVNTFLNPQTSRIIGYKGIPRRKRRFSTLESYSPFWEKQNRFKFNFTQPSVLVGPSQA